MSKENTLNTIPPPLHLRRCIEREAGKVLGEDAKKAAWQRQLEALEQRKRTETFYFLNVVIHKLSTPSPDDHAQEFLEKTQRETQRLMDICQRTWNTPVGEPID